MPLIPDTGRLSVLIRISIILTKVNVGKQFGKRVSDTIRDISSAWACGMSSSVYIEIPPDQLLPRRIPSPVNSRPSSFRNSP